MNTSRESHCAAHIERPIVRAMRCCYRNANSRRW
jgi:hypothetical protein